jgi:hypothetical protein
MFDVICHVTSYLLVSFWRFSKFSFVNKKFCILVTESSKFPRHLVICISILPVCFHCLRMCLSYKDTELTDLFTTIIASRCFLIYTIIASRCFLIYNLDKLLLILRKTSKALPTCSINIIKLLCKLNARNQVLT